MLTMRFLAKPKASTPYVLVSGIVFVVCYYTRFTRYGLLTAIIITTCFGYLLHRIKVANSQA